MSEDWRDDPELVRQGEDMYLEEVELNDRRWRRIFDEMLPTVLQEKGRGVIGMAIRLTVWNARKYVAKHPVEARATVVEALRMTVAALEVEPLEVYEELGAGTVG